MLEYIQIKFQLKKVCDKQSIINQIVFVFIYIF